VYVIRYILVQVTPLKFDKKCVRNTVYYLFMSSVSTGLEFWHQGIRTVYGDQGKETTTLRRTKAKSNLPEKEKKKVEGFGGGGGSLMSRRSMMEHVRWCCYVASNFLFLCASLWTSPVCCYCFESVGRFIAGESNVRNFPISAVCCCKLHRTRNFVHWTKTPLRIWESFVAD